MSKIIIVSGILFLIFGSIGVSGVFSKYYIEKGRILCGNHNDPYYFDKLVQTDRDAAMKYADCERPSNIQQKGLNNVLDFTFGASYLAFLGSSILGLILSQGDERKKKIAIAGLVLSVISALFILSRSGFSDW